MRNKIDQIIIFVFCMLFCCSLTALAESRVVSDNNVSSLAGFKVHTVILQSEPETKQIPPTPASSISTNNELIKKNRYRSRVTDNFSSNVVSTNSNAVKSSPKAVITNRSVQPISQAVKSERVYYPKNKAVSVKKLEPNPSQPSSYGENNIVKKSKPADFSDKTLPDSITGEAKQIKEPSFITLAGSLIVVILLVFMFAWIYNKLRGINTVALLSGKLKKAYGFNLLSTTSLGQGKSIHLVEIKGKQLVIGSTNSNINLLTEFGKENTGKSSGIISEFTDMTDESDEQNNEISDVYKEYLDKND